MKSKTWIFRDVLSSHRTKAFDSLLCRRLPVSKATKHLQLGEHFLFFPPSFEKLDRDGYFNYQNPASLLGNPDLRYRRRIWGQGELVQYLPVTLDQEYTCHESIKYVKKYEMNMLSVLKEPFYKKGPKMCRVQWTFAYSREGY